MNKHISITLAYPTYNRSKAITTNLKNLYKNNIPDNVKVMIIDNKSKDNTYKNLLNLKKKHNFNLIRNKKNIGAIANIYKLFKVTKTDYLIISSDEDQFLVDNLYNLNYIGYLLLYNLQLNNENDT